MKTAKISLLIFLIALLAMDNTECEETRIMIRINSKIYPEIIGDRNGLLHVKLGYKFIALREGTYEKMYEHELSSEAYPYFEKAIIAGDILVIQVSDKQNSHCLIYKCASDCYDFILKESIVKRVNAGTLVEGCSANMSEIYVISGHIVSIMAGIISVYNYEFEKIFSDKYYCNKTAVLASGIYEYVPEMLRMVYDFEKKSKVSEEYKIDKALRTSIISTYRDYIIIHMPEDVSSKETYRVVLSCTGKIVAEIGKELRYFGITSNRVILCRNNYIDRLMTVSYYECPDFKTEKQMFTVPLGLIYVVDDNGTILIRDDKRTRIINVINKKEIVSIEDDDTESTAYIREEIIQCGRIMSGNGAELLCKNLKLSYEVCVK